MHRYYLPDFNQPHLASAEAHHCRHVLRQAVGDVVTVFDGHGTEARGEITEIAAQTVRLVLRDQCTTAPLPARITLAQAIPKKNMDLIVQKATELGVAAIQPLFSERTASQPGRDVAHKTDRWRLISLDACKQSGNNWLPDLLPAQPLATFLATLPRFGLALIGSLESDARPLRQILQETNHGPAGIGSVLALIGPEGDFTPAEIAAARAHGCQPLSLGPLVLRADTAALYTLSILHHELQTR